MGNAVPISEVRPSSSAVFLDNITLAASQRLVGGNYNREPVRAAAQEAQFAQILVGHDVVCLQLLVEAIVMHESIFVNAKFVDLWRDADAAALPASLSEVITAVEWDGADSLDIERQLADREAPPSAVEEVSRFGEVLYQYTECGRRARTRKTDEIDRETFLPYDETGHPWPEWQLIAKGTLFYTAVSEMLGVPYKPSPFRSTAMLRTATAASMRPQVSAAELAEQMLTVGRDEVARRVLDGIVDQNMLELGLPPVFSVLLNESASLTELIDRALDLRVSKDGVAFRKWSALATESIQEEGLIALAEISRSFDSVRTNLERSLGVTDAATVDLTLAWSPISTPAPARVPRRLYRNVHLQRHLQFLHDLHKRGLAIMRMSDDLERHLRQSVPGWLFEKIDWSERFRYWPGGEGW